MSHNLNCAIAVVGIDIGKNSFHVVGLEVPVGLMEFCCSAVRLLVALNVDSTGSF